MNEYNKLTEDEKYELGFRLAKGEITRECKGADWFNMKLKTGRRVVGSYDWHSENADFKKLIIRS